LLFIRLVAQLIIISITINNNNNNNTFSYVTESNPDSRS